MKKTMLLTSILITTFVIRTGQGPRDQQNGEKEQSDCCERVIRGTDYAMRQAIWAGGHIFNGTVYVGGHAWNGLQYGFQQTQRGAAYIVARLATSEKTSSRTNQSNQQNNWESQSPTSPKEPMSPFENVSRSSSPNCDLLGSKRKDINEYSKNQSPSPENENKKDQ